VNILRTALCFHGKQGVHGLQSVLIAADEFAHVLAAGAVAALALEPQQAPPMDIEPSRTHAAPTTLG